MLEMINKKARETVALVIGAFTAAVDTRKIVNQLDRRGFVEKDSVAIINQDKVAATDAVGGTKQSLTEALRGIGLRGEAAKPYAEAVQQGETLISVRTSEDRAEEVANLLRQAQAKRVESQAV